MMTDEGQGSGYDQSVSHHLIFPSVTTIRSITLSTQMHLKIFSLASLEENFGNKHHISFRESMAFALFCSGFAAFLAPHRPTSRRPAAFMCSGGPPRHGSSSARPLGLQSSFKPLSESRHAAPYTMHHAPCFMHHVPCTAHHALCTTHPSPCTTHHAPFTVHHAPRTIHRTHHVPRTMHTYRAPCIAC